MKVTQGRNMQILKYEHLFMFCKTNFRSNTYLFDDFNQLGYVIFITIKPGIQVYCYVIALGGMREQFPINISLGKKEKILEEKHPSSQ